MNIFQRIKRFFHREPDFYIGGKENPYIRRWWIIPRNRFFNVYLHNILRDDDDRAHHDHPWWWCSIMLRGAYWEVTTLVDGEDFTFDETTGSLDVFDPRRSDDLKASYTMDNGQCYGLIVARRRLYRAGDIRLHRPTFTHRLEMAKASGSRWTLFITGPVLRTWGFWCGKRFVPWHDFVDDADAGKVGRGCGENSL